VADPLIGDPDAAWYVQEYGEGAMVAESKVFGRVFLSNTESEDLIFV
jgi:hypothetical protein